MASERYFIAETWGWPPSEIREMYVSERKDFIRRKVNTHQQHQLDLLEKQGNQE